MSASYSFRSGRGIGLPWRARVYQPPNESPVAAACRSSTPVTLGEASLVANKTTGSPLQITICRTVWAGGLLRFEWPSVAPVSRLALRGCLLASGVGRNLTLAVVQHDFDVGGIDLFVAGEDRLPIDGKGDGGQRIGARDLPAGRRCKVGARNVLGRHGRTAAQSKENTTMESDCIRSTPSSSVALIMPQRREVRTGSKPVHHSLARCVIWSVRLTVPTARCRGLGACGPSGRRA